MGYICSRQELLEALADALTLYLEDPSLAAQDCTVHGAAAWLASGSLNADAIGSACENSQTAGLRSTKLQRDATHNEKFHAEFKTYLDE